MTLRTRLTHVERNMPTLRSLTPVTNPLPKVIAFVDAHGGRQPQEAWAAATARLCGVTTGELLAELRERADA
ncbi:hypothetical protein [Devosia alba]|uniref:hypothetical protein n=1 Tax=Devosia alba TaxID=3152360 RepID=UPI003265FDAA